jgi:PAS domain S-box-containing protein
MHPDDLEYFMKNFQELLQEPGRQIILQYRVKHKDGSWAWLETVGVNHLHTPYIKALVGNFRNITDRKLAEEKLRENEARLNLALEAGDIGVWDWDVGSNRIHWTDKVYEIHEVEKDAFHGSLEHYTQRIHPDDKERVEHAIQQALENKVPYNIEFRIITAKGNVKWISTSAKVMFENNKPVRMLGATVDITRRKFLEGQKDVFIGMASHELKTPVTSIKAYGQVLQHMFEKEGNETAVAYMQKMDKQVNKLTSLIGDLLDVTKIQSGRLVVQEEEYDLAALVNEIVADMQLTSAHHTIIKKSDGPIMMYGDKERTGQVITNLISNAIKYSPRGGDIIITTTVGEKDVTVCVQDFGIGISAGHINKVFEQFFRVSGDGDHTYPGLGLGLYICGEIIKRQGGKIWAESTKGEGSSFYFSLPKKKSAEEISI